MSFPVKLTPNTPVTDIHGVGKARAAILNKLGIFTARDLIYHFPRSYENRGDVRLLGSYSTDTPCSYILTVATEVSSAKINQRLTVSKFRAFDESGSCEVVFFNSPFVKDIFHIGGVFRFFGKTSFSKNKRLTLTAPKYEPFVQDAPLADLAPVYPLTEGITSKTLLKLIGGVINDLLPVLPDFLPDEVRLNNSLPTLSTAIKNLHFPENENMLISAARRMAFDELFIFGLNVAFSRRERKLCEGVSFKPCSLEPFTKLLPYELTRSQKDAINDVYRDTVLRRENGKTPAMARIIVGDVGSGKTVCAEAAIYIAKQSGYQSVLMVPTEILANQHYKDLSELLGKLGLNVALLTGSLTAAQKRKIYESVRLGETDVVVGTHALLSEKLEFSNLGLIVTDEQHRFGVNQRAVLKDKALRAHMLVMSATPIPRTLALALYGDLDISRITELPKGRLPIDTYVVNDGYRERLNAFIKKQVELGGQCYVVCPSIEENDEENQKYLSSEGVVLREVSKLKNAVEYTEQLRSALPNIKIECMHGRMKNAEKDAKMSDFVSGKTSVLVSTTVIEVGVNVPNASLIVIEDADRFGLSQLHQLRGRVGRGNRKSYCILVSNLNTDKAKARLEVMRSTLDGYEIADKDLMLRGPGDFLSSNNELNLRQSGGFEFKFASLTNDTSMLSSAFEAAKSIVNSDPNLEMEEHKNIKEEVERCTTSISTLS